MSTDLQLIDEVAVELLIKSACAMKSSARVLGALGLKEIDAGFQPQSALGLYIYRSTMGVRSINVESRSRA
jgi:hypothetical protein